MERIVHAFLLVTSVVWPASFIATSVALPPVGLLTTAMILTFVLFSIRYFKNLFRRALDSYLSEQA
jgi:hypothetical protein